MSVVTSIILTTSLVEEDDLYCPAVEELNEWMLANRYGEFKRVDEYAGGNKAMQAVVFMGAFNYLDMDKFAETFRKVRWEDRDSVKLFVQYEEETCFSELLIPLED